MEGFFAAQGVAHGLPDRTETQFVSEARARPWCPTRCGSPRGIRSSSTSTAAGYAGLNVPVPGNAEPVGILVRSGAAPSELASQLMEALRELA